MDTQRQSDSLAVAVLEAVSERDGTDVEDLAPLADAVDPDALDQLFATRFDGVPRRGGTVRFPYSGYTVTVADDGNVELDARNS